MQNKPFNRHFVKVSELSYLFRTRIAEWDVNLDLLIKLYIVFLDFLDNKGIAQFIFLI